MISTSAQVPADDDSGRGVLIHVQKPCTIWVLQYVGGNLARRPSEEAVVADLVRQSVMVARESNCQCAGECYDQHHNLEVYDARISWTLCC